MGREEEAGDKEPNPFADLLTFKDFPMEEEQAEEAEGEEEAAGSEEDGAAAAAAAGESRSPFFAPTPSRFSTSSSSSSLSAQSSRQSRGSLSSSFSPSPARSSVTKRLDLTEGEHEDSKEEQREEDDRPASSRRRSTRGQQELAAVQEDDESEPLAARGSRRSSAGRPAAEAAAEDEPDRDMESKYADDGDDGDAAMDYNEGTAADDDDEGGENGHAAEEERLRSAELSPTRTRLSASRSEFASRDSSSSMQPPRAPAQKRSRGRSRRETTRLVENARLVGLVRDDDEEEEQSAFGRRARPKRNRVAPLEYWRGEHIEYSRTNSGIADVMPVPVAVVRAQPTPVSTQLRSQPAGVAA